MRLNIRVGIQYIEAWLGGLGCVPLYNLMEDAATAEISRSQVWQWIKHGATLADGRKVTKTLFDQFLAEELERIKGEIGIERFERGNFERATQLFSDMSKQDEFAEFLTIPAYEYI